jgi:lysyl-tRNA synthetase, class II
MTEEKNEQVTQRKAKLTALREQGNAYPNHFRRNALAGELDDSDPDLGDRLIKVAGRLMTRRIMGKASFANIQDMSGQIQLYVQRDALAEGFYNLQFKKWDIGDIIGVEGKLFRTKTGQLSIKVSNIELLTKSLRPLPEKFHGLNDLETCYRQRYVDLIMSEETRNRFKVRSAVIAYIRDFLIQRQYLEVETPMMQAIPGGAVARPFKTHHNALDVPLYLRIAPELYLKRLVVGGFEKVFEINRNFRNEGLSTRHNPEFTMLEFYQSYADYHDLMDLTESLFQGLAKDILQRTHIEYQGESYNFAEPFKRLTVIEAILEHNTNITDVMLNDIEQCKKLCEDMDIQLSKVAGLGKMQIEIFEKTAEHKLKDPTFITAYPAEVSPLARRNDDNPFITDRFELFIGGREIANGFSELNDSEDQAERFQQQVQEKDAGDQEAMFYDADYITALEYGLPPTAGEGIGIDRLVMLLTNSPSIKDVLLFPLMRQE